MDIWCIEFDSYNRGTFKGHVYAFLSKANDLNFERISVESLLTKEWAKELNKYESGDFNWIKFVGGECPRFLTKDEAIKGSIEMFLNIANPGDILYNNKNYLAISDYKNGVEPLAIK